MNVKQRKYIEEHIDQLVGLTEYKSLMEKCRSYNLLSEEMKFNLESEYINANEKHRQLFKKITHRGPDAYQKLKNILLDLDNHKALQILISQEGEDDVEVQLSTKQQRHHQPTIRKGDTSESNVRPLQEFSGEIHRDSMPEIIKSVEIGKDDGAGVYKMTTKDNRGVLLLANNIEFAYSDPRTGAEMDSRSLIYTFKELGFKIFAYENCSKVEFFRLLEELLVSEHMKKTECFVLALLSHGDIDDTNMECVEFSDGSKAQVKDILNCFRNQNCEHLESKPKVLLLPFCRGKKVDYGTRKKIQTDASGVLHKVIPTLTDTLVCHAVPKGFQSHRDTDNGSWYIQHLCEVIAHHAHNTHFEGMLKLVDQGVSKILSEKNSLQTATYEGIGFNKYLYLNPGCWIN